MSDATPRTPDTLNWGHGPKVFEVFLEPTCPNSARAFGKLMPLLERAGEDELTIRITLQSQPWRRWQVNGVLVQGDPVTVGRQAALVASAQAWKACALKWRKVGRLTRCAPMLKQL